MNADGTNVRQITHNTLWDEGPAWSPDGTKFAFSSGADDLHLDIWTMNVDGSNPRQLTTYPGRDESPDWGVNPHPAARRRRPCAPCSRCRSGAGRLRRVHPGRRARLHGDRDRHGHEHGRQRDAVASPTPGNAPGHLVNGTFSLPQPLQAARRRRDVRDGARGPAALRRRRCPTTRSRSVQAVDRRDRRAAHRDLRQDADVHAVDDGAVTHR